MNKFNTKTTSFYRLPIILALALLSVLVTPAQAADPIPHALSKGSPAVADEINANFNHVIDAINGIALTPGPEGSVGATGLTGMQGPTGNDGATGPQGPAGNDGATGPQGPAGNDGATGPQGPAGNDGATGPQGPAGNDGATGPQGPAGNDGATGPQGPAGTNGTNGIDGQNGASCTVTQNTGSASIECPIGTIATVYDGAGSSGGVTGNTQGDMQYWDSTANPPSWVVLPAPTTTNSTILTFCGGKPHWAHGKCYSVGSTGPAGGIVFYITDGGAHGMEVHHGAVTTSTWGCNAVPISGADGFAIGSGAQNTLDIIAGCTTEVSAAEIATGFTLNGYNDWFLPSKDELNELYMQNNILHLPYTNNYWTSSENDSNTAWGLISSTGTMAIGTKSATLIVRPIRAF